MGALRDGNFDVDRCFNYWAYGFKQLPPKRLLEWPGFLKMVLEHNRRRDILVEAGQTYITDVDNCIECMRVCPVGSRSNKIRPKRIVPQKTGGTG